MQSSSKKAPCRYFAEKKQPALPKMPSIEKQLLTDTGLGTLTDEEKLILIHAIERGGTDARKVASIIGENKLSFDKVPNTIIANSHGSFHWHPSKLRSCTDLEYCRIGSYPVDYNFLDNKPKYLIGVSVPPVMVAQIANNIFNQWLNEI